MPNLYNAEITITATAYVIAESEDEARAKISALHNTGIEFSDRRQQVAEELFVTGESYGMDMPELSLSPAMTINYSATRPYVCLVEELNHDDDGQDRESYTDDQDRESYTS